MKESQNYHQLRRHLEYLLAHDFWFYEAWNAWGRIRRARFLSIAAKLDTIASEPQLEKQYSEITMDFRRLFLMVPERDIVESIIKMSGWIKFATDTDEKEEVFEAAFHHLARALNSNERPLSYLYLYGGLKMTDHLLKVPTNNKEDASQISKILGDLWDIVRLRIVAQSPLEVALISLKLWEHHLDDMIKARNYYLNPRASTRWFRHPYRAVHFQMPILDRMVELQVMTSVFEVISYLDHAVLFKKRLDPLDEEHLKWLKRVRLAGVVLEGRSYDYMKGWSKIIAGMIPKITWSY